MGHFISCVRRYLSNKGTCRLLDWNKVWSTIQSDLSPPLFGSKELHFDFVGFILVMTSPSWRGRQTYFSTCMFTYVIYFVKRRSVEPCVGFNLACVHHSPYTGWGVWPAVFGRASIKIIEDSIPQRNQIGTCVFSFTVISLHSNLFWTTTCLTNHKITEKMQMCKQRQRTAWGTGMNPTGRYTHMFVEMYTCSNTALGRKRKNRWFYFLIFKTSPLFFYYTFSSKHVHLIIRIERCSPVRWLCLHIYVFSW